MHLLLVLLLLLPTAPRSAAQETRLQEEGARELARRMRTDANYQRGRLLAQTVLHYRIAVTDHLRERQGPPPSAPALVREGYLLVWASAGVRPVALEAQSGSPRNLRLLQDGPLPDFAYLSYGLEHPEGAGEWKTTWRWISTNIGQVVEHAQNTKTPFAGRRRGIEIQLAAPLELAYLFHRTMPESYAAACQASRLAPLTGVAARPELAGLSLWVQPGGNRYAIVWDEADGSRTATVYGYAPDKMDPQRVGGELPAEFIQLWPPLPGTPPVQMVDAEILIGQFEQVLPKNEGEPRAVDIDPWG